MMWQKQFCARTSNYFNAEVKKTNEGEVIR